MHALLGGFTHTRIPVCMFASFTRVTYDFAAVENQVNVEIFVEE